MDGGLCQVPGARPCVRGGLVGHVRKIRERTGEESPAGAYFVDMRLEFMAVMVGWLVWASSGWAQTSTDTTWVVSGSVSGEGGRWIPSSMVVNRRSSAGEFIGQDMEFLVRVQPGDTLVFGAVGYHSLEKVVHSPSRLDVKLRMLQVEVGTAEVIAPRTLQEIVRDIQALGYNEEDFRLSGVNAMQSPITFLYEAFSRQAISKRQVEQLENDDRRRALLQELFTKYVDYDIVDLEPWEFESFARFCDPGDEQLKRWSQYEFIQYVKQRYQVFRMMPRTMPAEDMDYHLDED